MIGENIGEEIDCANFFDNIEDLLEDLDHDVDFTTNSAAAAFPPIWSTTHSHSLPSHTTPVVDPLFSDSALSPHLCVPYDDQMEWLSNFVDDSFTGAETLTINTSTLSPPTQFHISSPVSVLDSSSSSSSSSSDEKIALTSAGGRRGRARSKRPRPPSFIPRPPQLISPTNSGGKVSSESENYDESCSPLPLPTKKTKKIKLTFRRDQNDAFNPQGVRKCLHCEVTKTPQWRAGPLGPKTLCNACGVRYKSGRLYPEYRPAASPTFVPCLHSNSHKKVLEMRIKQVKKGGEFRVEEETPPELIPNTNSGYIRPEKSILTVDAHSIP